MVSVTVHRVPTGRSGVVPVAPRNSTKVVEYPFVHEIGMAKFVPATSPPVSPATTLVTLTWPKIGNVGFVTVSVTVASATTVAVAPGSQVGVPQAYAGFSRFTAGGSSATMHEAPAGSLSTVLDPPSPTVTLPAMPAPQS